MTERLLETPGGARLVPAPRAAREPLDPARAAQLVVSARLRQGRRLSGRFFHALDDLDELLAA